MRKIGLDIGSYSIKVAEVEHHGSSVKILSLREFPLSTKAGVDKELELITSLKEIHSTYQIPGENLFLTLGLPQNKVSTRTMFFPFKEKYKILKSLPFELEDLTPFSLDDAIFDVKILERNAIGAKVIGIAAPIELIKKKLGLCSDVQIDPDVLTLEGLALNNLFEDVFAPVPILQDNEEAEPEGEDEDDDESSDKKASSKPKIAENLPLDAGEAILNVGHSSSLLIIRAGQSLKTVRHISWGATNVISLVAESLGMQPQMALQKIKASKGLLINKSQGTEEDWKLSELINQEVAKLGKLINLTLLEVKGSHQVDIKGMGLLGGFSATSGLGPKLTQHTKIPCNNIVKIKNYPEIDTRTNLNQELSMAVALGLALEGCKKSINPPVNFRKDAFEKSNSTFKNFWSDWGFFLQLGAASIAVFFVYAFLRNTIAEDLSYKARKNMRSAASSVFKIKSYNAKEKNLTKTLTDLEKREKTKEKILAYTLASPSPLKALRSISEKASSRLDLPIDLKKLTLNKKNIQISGTSSNEQSLKSFKKKLKALAVGPVNSNRFKTQNIDGKRFVDFSFSFKPKKELF